MRSTTDSELFSDNDVTGRVLDVIRNAEKWVTLVTPYIDRVGHVEQELTKAKASGVELLIVVRKDGNTFGGNNSKDALAWFKEQGMSVKGVPSLHAKFYMNEKEAVVTSMNLLRSSWSGSLELGTSVVGDGHRLLIRYLRDHLSNFAVEVERSNKKVVKAKTQKSRPRRSNVVAESPPGKGVLGALGGLLRDFVTGDEGYCIRCGDGLSREDLDADFVLCKKDFRSWNRYKDEDYKEKYCTGCGNESVTSYAKPLCDECYFGS